MKKFFLYFSPLAIAAGVIYWLDRWLSIRALAIEDSEGWRIVSHQGWWLTVDLWPVLATVGVVVVVVTHTSSIFFHSKTIEIAIARAEKKAEEKHENRKKAAERRAEEALERARAAESAQKTAEDRAREKIERHFAERYREIEELEAEKIREIAAAKNARQNALAAAEEARKHLEKTAYCVVENEEKKQAATAFSNRLRKKTVIAIREAFDGDSSKLNRLLEQLEAQIERENETPRKTKENHCLNRAKEYFS